MSFCKRLSVVILTCIYVHRFVHLSAGSQEKALVHLLKGPWGFLRLVFIRETLFCGFSVGVRAIGPHEMSLGWFPFNIWKGSNAVGINSPSNVWYILICKAILSSIFLLLCFHDCLCLCETTGLQNAGTPARLHPTSFFGKFWILVSVSTPAIGLFRFSVSSWLTFGGYVSGISPFPVVIVFAPCVFTVATYILLCVCTCAPLSNRLSKLLPFHAIAQEVKFQHELQRRLKPPPFNSLRS